VGGAVTTLVATGIRDMLADVTAFRTFVGAADQGEALAAIHVAGVAVGYTRACAIVGTSTDDAAVRYASGPHDYFEDPGTVIVVLEGDDVDPDALEDSLTTFLNHLGAIWAGLEALSGQGYPVLRSIEMPADFLPVRSHQDEADDYYAAGLVLARGIM